MWPINYQYVTKLKYMSILDGVFFTNIKLICWNINKITLLTSYIYICYIRKKKCEPSTLYLQLLM